MKKLLTIALFNSVGFSNSVLEAAYGEAVDQLSVSTCNQYLGTHRA